MEKQCLLMRGCGRKCWKALKTFETIENTKICYGKTRFINAGMLAELLQKHWKPYQYKEILSKNKVT